MVQIKIERVGDDTHALVNMWERVTNDLVPGLGTITFGHMPSRAWCAEIIGLHPKYKFERKFLKGNRDYSQANKVGSRGVYDFYNLEEGHIYEISSPESWKRTDRYFCQVQGEELVRMTKEEVLTCLNAASE